MTKILAGVTRNQLPHQTSFPAKPASLPNQLPRQTSFPAKPASPPNQRMLVIRGPITRKDKKNLDKNVTETNKRLKNYCRQKDIGYIDNSNITEDSLGIKKLHLNRKGNSFLAKNLLKYLTNV